MVWGIRAREWTREWARVRAGRKRGTRRLPRPDASAGRRTIVVARRRDASARVSVSTGWGRQGTQRHRQPVGDPLHGLLPGGKVLVHPRRQDPGRVCLDGDGRTRELDVRVANGHGTSGVQDERPARGGLQSQPRPHMDESHRHARQNWGPCQGPAHVHPPLGSDLRWLADRLPNDRRPNGRQQIWLGGNGQRPQIHEVVVPQVIDGGVGDTEEHGCGHQGRVTRHRCKQGGGSRETRQGNGRPGFATCRHGRHGLDAQVTRDAVGGSGTQ